VGRDDQQKALAKLCARPFQSPAPLHCPLERVAAEAAPYCPIGGALLAHRRATLAHGRATLAHGRAMVRRRAMHRPRCTPHRPRCTLDRRRRTLHRRRRTRAGPELGIGIGIAACGLCGYYCAISIDIPPAGSPPRVAGFYFAHDFFPLLSLFASLRSGMGVVFRVNTSLRAVNCREKPFLSC
jgi:hypothetical protein